MKVIAQNDDRFIIDPEDGKPEVVVVQFDGNVETLKVFPRTTSLDAVMKFGIWDDPDPDDAAVITQQLKRHPFPVATRP